MSRTTASAVQTLLGRNWDQASSVTPYIDTASAIVDQVVSCASDRGVTMTDATLELMERWLAAHFYTQMDPLYKSKTTGRASATFADQDYKKAAMQLDQSGCLAGIMSGMVAEVFWGGTRYGDARSWTDRNL